MKDMETESFNPNLACRGCLENSGEMRSIFQTENILSKKIKLCTVLNYCTNLDIYEGDGLPSQMCDICTNDVVKCFKFKQQFIRANTILREKLASTAAKGQAADNYSFEHVVVKQGDNSDDDEGGDKSNKVSRSHNSKIIEQSDERSNDSIQDYEPLRVSDDSDSEQKYSESVEYTGDGSRIKEEVIVDDDDSSNEDDNLKTLKEAIQAKLKAIPGGSQTNALTNKALESYMKEVKKRPKNRTPFRCDVCSKVLASASTLKNHMLCHSDVTPFLCSVCGKGFKVKGTYKEHLLQHNPNEMFKCDQCNKHCKNEKRLKEHKMRSHGKVKPFLCGVCGKGLTQKDSLMKHMMIHTGEKPFECDLCGKFFRYMSVLKLHKRYHTGERPYPCTECDKRFKERTHLRKHLMIHTGEKPHECDFCGKRFHTRTNLNVSVKNVFPKF